METVNQLIHYAEQKFDAVCDAYKKYPNQLVMELRVVKEDFEYACLVIMDRETRFINDYEFLWEWHMPKRKPVVEEKPKVLVRTNPQTLRTQSVVPNVAAKPVRRTIRELANA